MKSTNLYPKRPQKKQNDPYLSELCFFCMLNAYFHLLFLSRNQFGDSCEVEAGTAAVGLFMVHRVVVLGAFSTPSIGLRMSLQAIIGSIQFANTSSNGLGKCVQHSLQCCETQNSPIALTISSPLINLGMGLHAWFSENWWVSMMIKGFWIILSVLCYFISGKCLLEVAQQSVFAHQIDGFHMWIPHWWTLKIYGSALPQHGRT